MGQSLEGGFGAWGQGRRLAQQPVHHGDFSILFLNVLMRSPGQVGLQLVGTKEVMWTTCSPFLWRDNGKVLLAALPLIQVVNIARFLHHITSYMVQVGIPASVFQNLSSFFLQMLDLLNNDCQLVGSICSDEFISLEMWGKKARVFL